MANEKPIKELTITRTFDAPIESVWKAWTDPKIMAKWLAPKGFAIPVIDLDVRTGGSIYFEMEDVSGIIKKGYKNKSIGKYDEVKPMEKVIWSGSIMEGQFESTNTLTFQRIGDKTKINLHIAVTKAADSDPVRMAMSGMETGWNQSLDNLTDILKK